MINPMTPFTLTCISGVGDTVVVEADKLTFHLENDDIIEIDATNNARYIAGGEDATLEHELVVIDGRHDGELGIGINTTAYYEGNVGSTGDKCCDNVIIPADQMVHVMNKVSQYPMPALILKLIASLPTSAPDTDEEDESESIPVSVHAVTPTLLMEATADLQVVPPIRAALERAGLKPIEFEQTINVIDAETRTIRFGHVIDGHLPVSIIIDVMCVGDVAFSVKVLNVGDINWNSAN